MPDYPIDVNAVTKLIQLADGDSETWAFDEPHKSGGNCHVTMTRRQAIDWMRKTYQYETDDIAFQDWQALHLAYREPTEAPSVSQ